MPTFRTLMTVKALDQLTKSKGNSVKFIIPLSCPDDVDNESEDSVDSEADAWY